MVKVVDIDKYFAYKNLGKKFLEFREVLIILKKSLLVITIMCNTNELYSNQYRVCLSVR